jgi:adenylate cyclase
MLSKNRALFLVPAVVIAVFAILGIVGAVGRLDDRIGDLFLRARPPVPESPAILLVDIDDLAITRVGVWPWGRDLMANGLILMREFGAASAAFDIEYLNASPRGVDGSVLRGAVPDAFNQEFSQLETNIQQLGDAVRSGSIQPRDVGRYAAELSGLAAMGKQRLLDTVRSVERDNDAYLGSAARFFGSAYFTVNLPPEAPNETAPADLVDYALSRLSLGNLAVAGDPAPVAAALIPAIKPVLAGAAGAGFPNVIVDPDGVRRRIDLVRSYRGKHFAQLAFRPLLAMLGNPAIELHRNGIFLKGAVVPGKAARDIAIPLGAAGDFLINWPHKRFLPSFRHISFYELVLHQQLEEDLLYNLKLMSQSGYLSYHTGESGLLETWQYAESVKKEVLGGGDTARVPEYVKARSAYFSAVGDFLGGDAEKRILADIDRALEKRDLSAAEKRSVEEVRADVGPTFEKTRGIYADLVKTREVLGKNLPGSFCVVGLTATSTTDIGVNPFDNQYPNVGTHASVVNSVLQGQFLRDTPWWYSLILAIVLTLAATFLLLRLDPRRSLLVGSLAVVVVLGALVLWFRLTGVYLAPTIPVGSVFFTFVALTAIKFLRSEQEKSQVRNAFNHYLSTDVINQLLENPERLNLGGEKKILSAIFTDVKGFSTISEALDSNELVHLLNIYLTEMSDIILDLGGTIDKFEGDAIISFFGAPVEISDHPRRACLAAVRLKRAEARLNARVIEDKLTPSPLLTRIGINTGEMTVGNMGTAKKMNYTIMGNSVNLAARLEGVNKQYGTWILMSEATQEAAGHGFLVRKLDQVRVVGIQKPVRLYELVEEKGHVDKAFEQAIVLFHEGLEEFEAKRWQQAETVFRRVLELAPQDGPAAFYLKRAREFREKPPLESWDGVFNLTTK